MFNPYTESRRIVQSGMDMKVITEVVKELARECKLSKNGRSEFDAKLDDLAQEVEYLQRRRSQ